MLFKIRQFLQLERSWSLDTGIDLLLFTSSTSGHLDMGIGEDRLERLITQNLAFRWTWSVDSAAILWILGWFGFGVLEMVLICDAEKYQN
ncbi:hypothetical protein RclHR1_17090002 [Rhizophagus clarus]|uniref:Uncharacterized protein n=1 Tax=Rhizophagus clarus TaxID=94130 RepID=A0A2Z6RC96_9GLOM|nr:hypothetical protein RclHR1_17090002 [Rhizophagus clarus]